MSATKTVNLVETKLVVEWRRLSRFSANWNVADSRARALLDFEKISSFVVVLVLESKGLFLLNKIDVLLSYGRNQTYS